MPRTAEVDALGKVAVDPGCARGTESGCPVLFTGCAGIEVKSPNSDVPVPVAALVDAVAALVDAVSTCFSVTIPENWGNATPPNGLEPAKVTVAGAWELAGGASATERGVGADTLDSKSPKSDVAGAGCTRLPRAMPAAAVGPVPV